MDGYGMDSLALNIMEHHESRKPWFNSSRFASHLPVLHWLLRLLRSLHRVQLPLHGRCQNRSALLGDSPWWWIADRQIV